MKNKPRLIWRLLVATSIGLMIAGAGVGHAGDAWSDRKAAGEFWADSTWSEDLFSLDTVPEVMAVVDDSKAVVELSETSIIIEVNDTDGDAGFQVFLDGEGWRTAWVFAPNGSQVFKSSVTGGIRDIGGGTELFLESAEPAYDDLDGYLALINLLPEGEYLFLAATVTGDWGIGSAELTHDVPAGPEMITPVPEGEEECAADVPVDFAVIEWMPVTTSITGEGDITIDGYQIIVGGEDSEFIAEVPAEVTRVTVPEELLEPGAEYRFEVLAKEESGNQTITESCFTTAD